MLCIPLAVSNVIGEAAKHNVKSIPPSFLWALGINKYDIFGPILMALVILFFIPLSSPLQNVALWGEHSKCDEHIL